MTGSPTSAPGRREAREREELLATKVTIPRIRPGCLARSRLLNALNEAMDRELILVCTPAGFGKTTLLADWAQSARWPAAWLSLDTDDSDPVRFWRYVVAALEGAGVPVGERARTVLEAPGSVSSHGLVTALLNELQTLPDEVALVLDDYQAVEARSIHEGLTYLVGHAPPHLHLLLATRSDPPLPLARLRARDQLAELRAADLRFTPEESAAFLRQVWELDLSTKAVATLEARTEGWAVGLQLAALSLQEQPDPEAFLDAFRGTPRYVLDYLSEEVLERQPDRVKEFLLQVSILERLSGSLCDAVTGRSDGQAMLEELEHANLFLIPLDDQRRWYRFHHLFADLLRVRLPRSEALVPELHRRAAAWCEQRGLIDEAIRHASASGDSAWAAQLVEEHLDETLRRGETAILEQRLRTLPEEVVRSRLRLSLAQAMLAWHVYRLDEVERALQGVEDVLEGQPDASRLGVPTEGGMVADVGAAISLLRAQVALTRGEVDVGIEHVHAALARMGEEEGGPRFWARWLLLVADWIHGRMEDAEASYSDMLAEGRATPDAHPLMTTCFPLGQVRQTRGKLGAALRTYREGLRIVTEGRDFSPFHVGEAHIGIAQVLHKRNHLEGALRHATHGVEVTRKVVEFLLLAAGLQTLAWILQARGNTDGAREAMEEAVHLLPNPDVCTWWYPGHAGRARLALAQGRVEEAERWTEERHLRVEDEVSLLLEQDHLVLARVLLARSEPAPALRLLMRLERLAESQGRRDSLIRILALRALALQSTGDHEGALALVAEALSLARPEGYIRVFADEGPPMAALLRSLITARQRGRIPRVSRIAQEHVARVARAFGPPTGERAPVAPGLIEPLTDREVEVLRLVAAGERNQEIARELVVTLDTVKKHVSHIFDKLGAANRTEAVAKARDLGLIP